MIVGFPMERHRFGLSGMGDGSAAVGCRRKTRTGSPNIGWAPLQEEGVGLVELTRTDQEGEAA